MTELEDRILNALVRISRWAGDKNISQAVQFVCDEANRLIAEENAEVRRLRALAATCYAGLGAECNLPERWLDVLNAAANGEPFDTEGLLPFKLAPFPTIEPHLLEVGSERKQGEANGIVR